MGPFRWSRRSIERIWSPAGGAWKTAIAHTLRAFKAVAGVLRKLRHHIIYRPGSSMMRAFHRIRLAGKRKRRTIESWVKKRRTSSSKSFRQAAYKAAYKLLMRYHRQLCFLDFYMRASRVVANRPADVYHAHDFNTLPIAYLLARRHGAKLVYDSHEYYLERNLANPYSRLGKFYRRLLEGFFVRRADLAITVNTTISNEISKLYGVSPLKVIMNTPSLAPKLNGRVYMTLREEFGIPSDMRLLIYVGAITFNRGLHQLIESLTILDDCELIFMGHGTQPFKQRLQDHAVEKGVADRFHFFGPVPSDMVTAYAAGADIGVAPIENVCLSYYFCSPNKVFEYILAGLPVIASDFPELGKIVADYGVGFTFDPSDHADIARAARKVLDTSALRERVEKNMGAASRAFNWENESRKLLQYYQALWPTDYVAKA